MIQFFIRTSTGGVPRLIGVWHEVFADFTFASIEGIIKDHGIQFMPSRDPNDNSIIQYMRIGKLDTTKYTFNQLCRANLFVMEILLLRFFRS